MYKRQVEAAGGDERPDAGQRAANAGAQEEARPVSGIEEGVPEFARLMTCSGDGQPGVAGREHEGKNAVDDDERKGRSAGINPADFEVQLGVDLAPGGVVDGDGGQFDEKEDPPVSYTHLISYQIWHSRFNGDAHILGQKILLDRKPYDCLLYTSRCV